MEPTKLDETSNIQRILQKSKEAPMFPIGIIGLSAVVTYGLYNFRKTKMRKSLYLINLRLAGQGTLIGCVTLGLVYSIIEKNYSKLFGSKKE